MQTRRENDNRKTFYNTELINKTLQISHYDTTSTIPVIEKKIKIIRIFKSEQYIISMQLYFISNFTFICMF